MACAIRSICVGALIACLALRSPAADPETGEQKAGISTDVKIHHEMTWKKMDFNGKPSFSFDISLIAQGSDFARATACGDLKIDSIKDGDGKAVKAGLISIPGMNLVYREGYGARQPKDGLRIDVTMQSPPKKVSEMRGSFAIQTGGTMQVVTVKNVFQQLNRDLDDETLRSLGVNIRILRTTPKAPDKGSVKTVGSTMLIKPPEAQELLSCELKSGNNPVTDLQWIDAAGKPLAVLNSTMDVTNTIAGARFGLKEKLPADCQLRVTVHRDAKTIRVPFELKDVEAPPKPQPGDRTAALAPAAQAIELKAAEQATPIPKELQITPKVVWRPRPFRDAKRVAYLELSLIAQGGEIVTATAYGNAKVDSIKDGKGERVPFESDNLLGQNLDATDIVSFGNDHSKHGMRIVIDLELRSPPPKRLSEVSGSFVLRTGGSMQVVILNNLLKQFNREVENEALKSLGIRLRVTRKIQTPKKKRPGEFPVYAANGEAPDAKEIVTYEVTEGKNAVTRLEICNAKGEPQKYYPLSSGSGTGNAKNATIAFNDKLPDDCQLRVTIHQDPKRVRIPFLLKDVELPPLLKPESDYLPAPPSPVGVKPIQFPIGPAKPK